MIKTCWTKYTDLPSFELFRSIAIYTVILKQSHCLTLGCMWLKHEEQLVFFFIWTQCAQGTRRRHSHIIWKILNFGSAFLLIKKNNWLKKNKADERMRKRFDMIWLCMVTWTNCKSCQWRSELLHSWLRQSIVVWLTRVE